MVFLPVYKALCQFICGVRILEIFDDRQCKINGWDLYYLNERSGECDFMICNGNNVLQAVQVSYDISVEKTRKREINGLLLANKMSGCDNLLLLTDHDYDEIEQNGIRIRIRPVYEWCLNSNPIVP